MEIIKQVKSIATPFWPWKWFTQMYPYYKDTSCFQKSKSCLWGDYLLLNGLYRWEETTWLNTLIGRIGIYIYIYILLLFVLVCKLCAHWNYFSSCRCPCSFGLQNLGHIEITYGIIVVVVIHLLLRFALLSHVGGCWRLADLLWSRKKWVHWVFGCKEGQVHIML